jgi:nucleoside-diphosphate-sugar epimerase
MTNILVTGASGFVGRSVCQSALALGMKVKGSHRTQNSAPFVPDGIQKIWIPAIDRDTDWSGVLNEVDVVIHLAGRVHVMKDKLKDTLTEYREVNTVGAERLASMAALAGVRRLVYISTIKVNGEETKGVPFIEVDTPRPEDAYAVSRWEAEQALTRVASRTGLEVVVLRPPLVYGRGVGANFLRLLQLVQKRIPLPLRSVSNLRSLLFVKNLSDAILVCATHPRVSGKTFVVSDGEDVSTPELLRLIAEAMGLSSRVFSFPPSLLVMAAKLLGKSGEVGRLTSSLVIDSSRIRSETGWVPHYTMAQGLKDTVDWYRTSELRQDKEGKSGNALMSQLGPFRRG